MTINPTNRVVYPTGDLVFEGSITATGGVSGNTAVTNNQTSVTLNMQPPINGLEFQYAQTLSFNPSTRVLTVIPTGTSYRVTSGNDQIINGLVGRWVGFKGTVTNVTADTVLYDVSGKRNNGKAKGSVRSYPSIVSPK